MKKFIITAALAISVAFFQNVFAATHYWTGTVSHYWGNSGNWNTGTVPGSGDDVVIVAGTPYSCWIAITDRQCNNLTVNTNANLRVYDEELTVNGNMDIYGLLTMDNSSGKIWAHNNVNWHSGSQASISAWTAIKVWGNWQFMSGSNVHLNNGFVELLGTGSQYIICKSSNSYFNTLVLNYAHEIYFSAYSTTSLVINNQLSIGTNAIFKSLTNESIILNGQLTVQGTINLLNGTFIYNGPSSNVTTFPHFNNLTVNSTGTLSFSYGLMYIYGDLTLNGGVFAPGNVQIFGDWINNVGPAGFDEGTSSIFFKGTDFQQCTSETFYSISIDKPGSSFSPQPGATIHTLLNTSIHNGTLKMTNNSSLQVGNELFIEDGAHLDATGSTGVNIYLYSILIQDNNTSQSGIIPGTSTFNFDISSNYFLVYSNAPTLDFYNITKTGNGALRFFCNTKVLNDVNIVAGGWNNDSNDNYDHYFYGDIILSPGAYFFEKNNIAFQGNYLHTVNLGDGFAIFGKTTVAGSKKQGDNGKGLDVLITSDNQDPDLSIYGDLTIENASFQMEKNVLKAYGNITINDGGEFILSEGTGLELDDNMQVNVNANGFFKAFGTAQKPVTVSRTQYSDGFYGFFVNLNGKIAAKHTLFEYMNLYGIRMKYGSEIDTGYPFDYCIFRNGEANGTFLFINSVQDITIANAVFEDNTFGSNFNISRTLNVGSVTLKWAKGDFAGEAHEYDYYGNVYWDYTPVQVSAKVFLEGPFNGTDMNTNLNSVLPLSQPYSGSPWNYNGSENVPAITNPNIVDWVLLELRTSPLWAATTTNESVVARRACFLLNDGTIVDTDNNTVIPFDCALGTNESLFMVVKHRNHLGVLSAWALTESSGVYNYDFSTGPGQVLGSNQGNKYLGNGIWGMYAGDANSDGIVNYNDINAVWKNTAGRAGYLQSDLNMDIQCDNKDKNDVLIPNLWQESQIPQ